MLEFALAGAFIFVPMLGGLATVGISMSTAMQVATLNSGAAQMLATGVDFTQSANITLVQNLAIAGNLNNATTGQPGGVVVLSVITGVLSGSSVVPTCTSQYTISLGIGATFTSTYCSGSGVPATTAFSSLLPGMAAGQTAYLSETYYNNSQFAWMGANPGIYAKALF